MDIFSLKKKLSIEYNKKLLYKLINDEKICNIGYFNVEFCKNKNFEYLYFYFYASEFKSNSEIKGVVISYSQDNNSWKGRGRPCIVEIKLLGLNNLTIYNSNIHYNGAKYIPHDNFITNELINISTYIDEYYDDVIHYPKASINYLPKCYICKNILMSCYCEEYYDDEDN